MHSIQIGLIVFVIVALGALKLLGILGGGAAKAGDYYLKKSLFSPAERSFLGVLQTVIQQGMMLESKVRLADVFGVKKGLERGDRQRAFNRICSKHVDFLLVQGSDGRPLLGIELDDISHDEDDRIARDEFVDSVFVSAGLPILHFEVKRAYEQNEIRRRITEALGSTTPGIS
jgi:hypothetical protein